MKALYSYHNKKQFAASKICKTAAFCSETTNSQTYKCKILSIWI